jgi:hypothetical protein
MLNEIKPLVQCPIVWLSDGRVAATGRLRRPHQAAAGQEWSVKQQMVSGGSHGRRTDNLLQAVVIAVSVF